MNDITLSPAVVAGELRPVLLRLARELRRETDGLEITTRQATLLWVIRERDGLSIGELAEEERISAPAATGHVDRLERLGLVERRRSPENRRRVGLGLTEEGHALLRRLRARRTGWLSTRLARLDEEELQSVERALPSLAKLLDGAA